MGAGMRCPRSILLAAALLPATGRAFSFESAFSHGCHEQITGAALRRVGWPRGERPPRLSVEDGLRLARDLPFDLPASAQDPWSLALLLGARDNDLRALAMSRDERGVGRQRRSGREPTSIGRR